MQYTVQMNFPEVVTYKLKLMWTNEYIASGTPVAHEHVLSI